MSGDSAPSGSEEQTLPDGLLYHYTTQKGLDGILQNENIWATHFRFLNDLSEQREGGAFLVAALGNLALNDQELLSEFQPIIQEILDFTLEQIPFYVVSFTEDTGTNVGGDRLSQWRGYSSNYPGFSLGFDGNRLLTKAQEMMIQTTLPTFLRKCVYREGEKRSIARATTEKSTAGINNQIEELVQKWDHHGGNDPTHEDARKTIKRQFRKLLNPLQEDLLEWSTRFKHDGFIEEVEWRLVFHAHGKVTSHDLIQFREGPFGRTPYIQNTFGTKRS